MGDGDQRAPVAEVLGEPGTGVGVPPFRAGVPRLGEGFSYYDRQTWTDAADVDIDHVVAHDEIFDGESLVEVSGCKEAGSGLLQRRCSDEPPEHEAEVRLVATAYRWLRAELPGIDVQIVGANNTAFVVPWSSGQCGDAMALVRHCGR